VESEGRKERRTEGGGGGSGDGMNAWHRLGDLRCSFQF
jgi:hypothetical protein